MGRYGPGAPGWIARIVGPGEDKIVGSALGVGSTIYAGGWFESTTSFNGRMLTSAGGRDLFLARFDTFTGAVDLTRTYGGTGREEISSAASNAGELVVAGMFDEVPDLVPPNTLAFGGTAQPLSSNGGLDVWVAKLDANGDGVWAVHYGGSGDDRDPRIAVDTAGDVYVAGSFTNQVAFGAVDLISKGGADAFVAKLHGSDGSVAWALSIGSTANDGIFDIAIDAADRVVVTGIVGGPIDGGDSAGGIDSMIASFDASDGAPRWRKVFSTPGDDRNFAITYGRNGDVYALVDIAGPYDFGMPILGAASPAAVMLRIAP